MPGSRFAPAARRSHGRARAAKVVGEFPSRAPPPPGASRRSTLSAAAIAQTGRPFHALSAQAQDQLIRRWENDKILRTPLGLVALVYKFVHLRPRRAPVYEAMGGKLNVVQNLESPRWLQQIHRADDWPAGEVVECDVVVVGTGAGGAVVGRELADRGHAVVFLEEGAHHRRDAFDGSSVTAHQRFYRGAFSVGNAPMPIFIGRLVGGSTAINGGTCLRAPSWILDRWCEELDTGDFAADAMKEHFDRVEGILQVAPTPRTQIGPIADVMEPRLREGVRLAATTRFAATRRAATAPAFATSVAARTRSAAHEPRVHSARARGRAVSSRGSRSITSSSNRAARAASRGSRRAGGA